MQRVFHFNDAQIQIITQIKGVFDLREEWVRELRNSKKVSAMKVDTVKTHKKHC